MAGGAARPCAEVVTATLDARRPRSESEGWSWSTSRLPDAEPPRLRERGVAPSLLRVNRWPGRVGEAVRRAGGFGRRVSGGPRDPAGRLGSGGDRRASEGWAAIGYAFTNANPETWGQPRGADGRLRAVGEPGPGAVPRRLAARQQRGLRPRARCWTWAARLDDLLVVDFNVQDELRRRGGRLFLESRALVAHENFETGVTELFAANHAYCRLMAMNRASGWSPWRAGPTRRPPCRGARAEAGPARRRPATVVRPLWPRVLP